MILTSMRFIVYAGIQFAKTFQSFSGADSLSWQVRQQTRFRIYSATLSRRALQGCIQSRMRGASNHGLLTSRQLYHVHGYRSRRWCLSSTCVRIRLYDTSARSLFEIVLFYMVDY